MDPRLLSDLDKRRMMLAMAAAAWIFQAIYIVSPIDFIPDFIPIIGWLDDLLAFAGLGGTTASLFWMLHNGGLDALKGERSNVIDAADVYDPIPTEVLRSM